MATNSGLTPYQLLRASWLDAGLDQASLTQWLRHLQANPDKYDLYLADREGPHFSHCLPELLEDSQLRWHSLDGELEDLKSEFDESQDELYATENEVDNLEDQIAELTDQISELTEHLSPKES